MILYRLQDDFGRGPWEGKDGAWLYNVSRRIGEPCSTMTEPKDDDGPEFHDHLSRFGMDGWYFACASLAQLLRWFSCPVGREAMTSYEFVELEVPREFVRVGDTQCLYLPSRATVIARLDRVTLERKD